MMGNGKQRLPAFVEQDRLPGFAPGDQVHVFRRFALTPYRILSPSERDKMETRRQLLSRQARNLEARE
jgi:hypothetical protein